MSSLQFRIDFTQKLPIAEQIRREAAIASAEAHADSEWKANVRKAIWDTCRECANFTADDVWERFERVNTHQSATHVKDAIGPLLRAVSAEGGMVGTSHMRRSRRKGSHGNPLMVWRSLRCDGGGRA